jgi:beta-N-acetylglucosaminidase
MILPISVKAAIDYTFPSGNYHVVWIKDSGTSTTTCDSGAAINYDSSNIEYISSYNTYEEALNYVNTITSNDTKTASIIGLRRNKNDVNVNTILYSQYALVDLNTTGTTMTNTLVYISATSPTYTTYINGHGNYGGVDAAFLNYDNGTTRANIKISNVNGWIDSLLTLYGTTYTGYDIIPLSIVKSQNYYYVNDSGELVHRLSRKVTANNCYVTAYALGPAPSSLTAKDTNGNMIKYYSFDGIYFYNSMYKMLDDYKNGNNTNSVNSIPYYNYYMYLPIRSKTNMTSTDIRRYLEAISKTTSKLYGVESNFIDAQNNYGVNALLSLSIAANESAWGTSSLAVNNNNLYGLGAADSSLGDAYTFNTVADCITSFSYWHIGSMYAEPKTVGNYYNGSHIGNKNSGINVKYAADPYWGEKAASKYYYIDNFNDMKDFNKNSIGIKVSSENVPIKKEANNSSKTLYTLKSTTFSVTNMPVIILERVVGESVEGNNIWYKIRSDSLLDDARENVIQDLTINDRYDWENDYAYVHSSYITLMGDSVNNIYMHKDGIFGLENLSLNSDKTINIKGYLGITGMNNDASKTITYDILFQNQNTNTVYELPLNRIMDINNIPFNVTFDSYNYLYSWFDGNLDLSTIPEGDYTIFVRARSEGYEAKELLSNILSRNTINKFDSNGRGYRFRTNYYLKTIPLELFIRDDGLISSVNPSTSDNMINQYHEIELNNGKLNISGSSFNIGGDYSTSKSITRNIIFENKETYDRYSYDLGYIDNGAYAITLIVPDNLDKTRAWFNNSIDISSLGVGTYSIYIKTVTNIEDYDELNDIFSRSINTTMTYNGKIYTLQVNENQRFRIELTIK